MTDDVPSPSHVHQCSARAAHINNKKSGGFTPLPPPPRSPRMEVTRLSADLGAFSWYLTTRRCSGPTQQRMKSCCSAHATSAEFWRSQRVVLLRVARREWREARREEMEPMERMRLTARFLRPQFNWPGRRMFVVSLLLDADTRWFRTCAQKPVSTEKQIITEHDHEVETHTLTPDSQPRRLDHTQFPQLGYGLCCRGATQSLDGLDTSAARLQSNLDDPDDWDIAETQ